MVVCLRKGRALTAWLLLPGLLVALAGQVAAQTAPPVPPPASDPPRLPAASGTPATQERASNRCDEPARKSATEGESTTPEPPPYKSLRYNEDYRYLKNPARRTDFWDPLKYIPLGGRDDWYLTLGGEVRERYEFFHNPDFGEAPANSRGNSGALLQRYLLHGDLHLGPHVRLFGQLMTTLEDGRVGGPQPEVDRNVFDAHQGFVDLIAPFGEKDSLTARLGRQEFEYGSGRLIAAREAPNNRRSFDAARLLLRAGEWAVDGFWGKPVRNRFNVFDDDPDPNKSLWGVYAVRPLPVLPDGHTDLYYLGFENKRAVFNQGTGYELRHTLGTRLWGQPKPWEYNFEFLWQFGRFGTGNIQAWAVASDTHYNFSTLPLKPRAGLRADITSGDQNPNTANLQTYNPLFPTGAYFNLADLGGPSNFIHLHPTLDLFWSEKLKTTLDWGFFWRTSVDDAVYSIGTFPIRPSSVGRQRYSGSSPAVTVVWEPTRHVTVLASYVHFFPGPFFQAPPPLKAVDYFTTWITYKF